MGYANTKYKTEKRKANVGERILITGKYDYAMNDMTVGNIYEVVEDGFNGDYVNVIDDEGEQASAQDGYYEVIIEAKPSKNERITLLESQVADLTAQVEALQNRRKPATTLTQAPTIHNVTVNIDSAKSAIDIGKLIADGFAKGLNTKPKPTPNEQRKAVIERAKAFVTEHTAEIIHDRSFPTVRQAGPIKVELHVNAKKRIVTAVVKWANIPGVRDTIFAKCAPDDVFNEDIGKAIALGRALGLDVSEFENAVKPTEAVIGQRVRYAGGRSIRKVTKEYENYATNSAEFVNRKIVDYDIIDDTEAQY